MSDRERRPGKDSRLFRRLLSSTGSSLRAARGALARSRSSKQSENARSSPPPPPPPPGQDPGMDLGSCTSFDPVIMAALSGASQRRSQQPGESSFDIFEWYPHYQNCQRYFLDRAQHSVHIQALASFLNIRLPFQRQPNPVYNSSTDPIPVPPQAAVASASPTPSHPPPDVSLIPYLRRLVATGMDFPGVLHGFFGDDWAAGVGSLHEQERQNYLFAAKSGGWAMVKRDYDILPLETVPFLRPLQGASDAEIEAAERSWSEWLALEDWMVGPRALDLNDSSENLRPSATS